MLTPVTVLDADPDPNGPDRLIRDNVRLTTYTYGQLGVDSVSYTSLHAAYNTNLMGGEQEFYFHVANLLDKDPPLVARASNYTGTSHTNRALFDMLGRRYTLGFRFNY